MKQDHVWTMDGRVLRCFMRGHDYDVYETMPGIYRLRRDGDLIAETFTPEEAKRWAETYDKWLEQVAPKMAKKPDKPLQLTDLSNWREMAKCQIFPRYPSGGDPI